MTLSTAWFGVLRNRGFDQVGWTDCIWPGNWPNIATARGAYFYKQAQQALRQNDIALAMRLLSSGYATCPQCWAQGLLLARLFEHVGQFAAADQLFTNLSQRFPEQREIIELNHHDALLASQRFFGLNRLAWLNIRSDRPSAGSWIVPLLLTARERPNWETLWETHTAEISDLTPEQQTLLSIVVPPAHLDEAQQVEQALKVPSGSALTARLRWELLLRYTGRSAALRSITQDAAQFNAFEYALARWATLAPAVSAKVRAQLWDQVITPPLQSLQVERICAVILANSYPTPLYQLRSRIADDDRSSLAAIWVVASVQGDESLARSVCAGLGLDPDDIQNQLTLTNARHSLPALASIIPIPREVLYALIHRTGSTAKAP